MKLSGAPFFEILIGLFGDLALFFLRFLHRFALFLVDLLQHLFLLLLGLVRAALIFLDAGDLSGCGDQAGEAQNG